MNTFSFLAPLAESFEILLRASGRGALMAAGVLALQAALGQRLPARWRYGLWLAVLAALILPPLSRQSIDVAPYRETAVLRYVFPAEIAAAPASLPAASGASVDAFSPRGLTGWEIAALVWVAGAIILAGIWLASHQLLMRRVERSAQETDEQILAQVKACGRVVGLRRLPRILQASAIESPAVTGWWPGTLLLPADAHERFSESELRFVLLHELAHLRRGDVILNWLVTAMLALHWFNPLLWFAAARLRVDRENACDATVLALFERDERSAYGHTLLKLHTMLSGAHRSPAFVGILEGAGSLRERIRRIAEYRAGGVGWGVGAAALAVGWLLCLGVELEGQTAASAPTAAAPANLETRLLQRLSGGQQIEIEAHLFQIDPAAGSITVGAMTFPPASGAPREASAFTAAGVLTADEGREFLEKLTQLDGVERLAAPHVTVKNKQRAVFEMIREFRYPTEWSEPEGTAAPMPKNFETRNLGVTLEVEPAVELHQPDMQRHVIDLHLVPQLVYFLGWEDAKTPRGTAVQRPIFSHRKVTTTVSIFGDQYLLLSGEMDLPEGKPQDEPGDQKASDVKLHRKTVLWVVNAKLLDLRAADAPRQMIANELFQRRDWRLNDAPIEQWVAYFTAQSRVLDPERRGLNLILGKPPTEPRRVTLDLKATSLVSALEAAARAAGMRVEDQGGNTLVLIPDA